MNIIYSKIFFFILPAIIFLPGISVFAQNDKLLQKFDQSIESGKLTEVERDLFNYVVANPKDENGFSLLAKLRFKQNRFNESKALANKALSLNPKSILAKLTLANAYFLTSESENVRIILDGISETEISDSIIRLNIAKIYADIGSCQKSIILTDRLPAKIKNSQALPIRGKCFLAVNDQKNFAATLTSAKTLAKQNPNIVIQFAEVLSKSNLHKETANLLRLVILSQPKNINALLLLAKSEIYLKNFTNAKTHLDQTQKIVPTSAELVFTQSLMESEQGENKKAFELIEKVLPENPNNVEYLSQYVLMAMRANYATKAVRAIEKLRELQPENIEFLYLYGAASLQNNNLKNAENALIKYLEIRPNDSRACVAFGLTLAAQPEKLDIARQQMQKCLTLNPNNSDAAYQLGLSYKTNGEFAKAIEYLEVTAKLSPNNANVLRDLGAVYLQSGAEIKARPILEKAVSINPNDSDTHFQLSRLYNLIGERELAKKHLEIFQKLKNPKKEGM